MAMPKGQVKDSYDRLRFGRYVARVRGELKLTYEDLAIQIGMGPKGKGSLAGAVRGRRGLPRQFRRKLVEILGPEAECKGIIDYRAFLQLAGLASTTGRSVAAPQHPSRQTATSWEDLMRLAEDQLRVGLPYAAKQFKQAAAVARQDGAKGKASLALARAALTTRYLNDDDGAWNLSEQVLELLGCPVSLLPESAPSEALIASTIRDGTELRAYATAVGVRAEVLLNDQKFTEVVEHADLLERIGQLTAESQLQWLGVHLRGRALVDRGTVADHPYVWRSIPTGQRAMPATIDVQAALISYLKADRLRHGAHNDLSIAHNLKGAAHVLRLLGDHVQAYQFESEAREIFGESPAAANLLMIQGKWAAARQDDAKAEAMLRMSADFADEYGVRLIVSAALGGLADLYLRQQRWSEAHDCAEVALATWPYARGARDAQRFAEVLRRAPRQTRVTETRHSTFPFNFLPADVDS